VKLAVYKDTLANNRGADVAVRGLVAALQARGHEVTLFERNRFAETVGSRFDLIVSTGTNEILDIDAHFRSGSPDGCCPVPVVQQFHTDPRYVFRHWIKKWRRNRAIRAALCRCAAIQVLREEYVAYVKKMAPNVPVYVIGNWSSYGDVKLGETNAGEKTIVYPAAVNKDKNQRLLQAAFSTLKGEFPDWRLELYGKGTENGFRDLREVYASCAFVAFPSKTEGFGLAIADAAVFGKPCVMIRDWIGTCAAGGGIVTAPNLRAYAEGLRRMMRDSEMRVRMGAAAKAYCAERYSRERILDEWESLLTNVVDL